MKLQKWTTGRSHSFFRMSRAQYWCFTLNNYDSEDVSALASLHENGVASYIVFGREVGAEGTPHLQGFIKFVERKRLKQLKRLVGDRYHWEIAKHPQKAADYCKKDGDFEEFGDPGFKKTGKRDEFQQYVDSIDSGVTDMPALRLLHPNIVARYPRWATDVLLDKITRPVSDFPLRTWQQELKDILDGEPDDRSIHFIVDKEGDRGKTWFAHWYASKSKKNVQVLVPGKKQDMAYSLDSNTNVIIVDAPRSKQGDFIQYDFLEEVKNGYVFSPKYESRMKTLPKTHVVVFMNEMPDMTKLSNDRYRITEI